MFNLVTWLGLGWLAYGWFGGHGGTPQSMPAGPQQLPSDPRALAELVLQDVAAHGYGYAKELVRALQRAAGIDADGLYGPHTAGAVQFFTGKEPPRPLYSDGSGHWDIVVYHGPEGHRGG